MADHVPIRIPDVGPMSNSEDPSLPPPCSPCYLTPQSAMSEFTFNNSTAGLSEDEQTAYTSSSMTDLVRTPDDRISQVRGEGSSAVTIVASQNSDLEMAADGSSAVKGTTDERRRGNLIELPYSLRTRKLKIAIIVFMVCLDGFILPTGLFYILKYAARMSDGKNIAITTAAFGFLSLAQYLNRLFLLLKPNSRYRPLGSPPWWYLDFYQIQFTIGFIIITIVLTLTTEKNGVVQVRNVSLAPTCLLVQIGPQFLLSCFVYKRGWKNPFRFSSSLKGEKSVPAVFTMVEDVIGVDGLGGGEGGFREKLKGRYLQSEIFREMIYKQTLFWGFGASGCAALTLGLVLAESVNQYVAYGIGWSLPFIWAGIWAILTTFMVQKDLRRERAEWDRNSSGHGDHSVDPEDSTQTGNRPDVPSTQLQRISVE